MCFSYKMCLNKFFKIIVLAIEIISSQIKSLMSNSLCLFYFICIAFLLVGKYLLFFSLSQSYTRKIEFPRFVLVKITFKINEGFYRKYIRVEWLPKRLLSRHQYLMSEFGCGKRNYFHSAISI